jgi:hypothetical protein
MNTLLRVVTVGGLLVAGLPAPLSGLQHQHILHPAPAVEQTLRYEPFEIASMRGSRAEGDRTQRVTLVFQSKLGSTEVKWGIAPPGGETFNNMPRYEIAAYEIQKLFLDEPDYVVPPTVLRSFPLAWYREGFDAGASPTFSRTESVIVALQYWLAPPLQPHMAMDRGRAARDPLYARHIAQLNLLTYLIRNRDNNSGNVLLSAADPPRAFSVDNGVSFRSQASDRGQYWSNLHVSRIPVETAERLRRIGPGDLERALGVIAQFELRGAHYEQVGPGENLDPGRGTRRRGNTLQFGLTTSEIRDVQVRLERLVQQIDSGRFTTF